MALRSVRLLILLGGLGSFVLLEAAWAHHPGPGAARPWAWLTLLVIGLALVVIWPVLAFFERRQIPPSQRRRRRKKASR